MFCCLGLPGKKLTLAGDGRCDSPGFSAKYGTYTLMDTETELVVDFQLTQCTETTSSVAMEKHGFETVLERTKESLQIATVVTDRNTSIKKAMRSHRGIDHQFDVWHYAKSVASKIRNSCTRKDHKLLLEWLPSIINHLWWCCQTCDGSAEVLQEKWASILYHVTNRHSWTEGKHFLHCAHDPLTDEQHQCKKWLKQGKTGGFWYFSHCVIEWGHPRLCLLSACLYKDHVHVYFEVRCLKSCLRLLSE